MSDGDHKLMSTPVSVNDGMKRADGRTWMILGLCAVAALIIVAGINIFVPKSKIDWPDSPSGSQETQAPPEPKTYDIAPPVRQKPNQ
jgi:hypothetical protein